MIVKKFRNSKKSATKPRRISALADYILSPTTAKDESTKCVFSTARGFISDEFVGQKKEMIALSQLVRKSKDTVNHYVISLQAGEQPTQQQFAEMVTIFMQSMGWKDHQVFAGLHRDTDNHHVHLVINRVHPVSEKVVEVNKGMDIDLAHKAIALIEHKQGWGRQKNGLYCVLEDGELARISSPKKAEKSPGQRQSDMEVRTGEKSAQRIVRERATNILSTAETWAALHSEMEKVGLRYEKFGSGAKIFVGDIGVKASDVENGGRTQIEKRLGPFQAAEKPTFFTHALIPEPPPKEEHGVKTKAKNISESKVILETATSWEQLHRRMEENGFRFEKKGSGAKVFLGENGLNASEISRKSSMSMLQKRLGVYQSRKINGNFFTHSAEQDVGHATNGARHGLQKLSERRLAHSTSGRIAGVLQINAQPDRSKLDSLRRQSKQPISEYKREPLQKNTEGWAEYQKARADNISKRKFEINEVDTLTRRETLEFRRNEEMLRHNQKAERKKYYGLDWRGSGIALIAIKSVLAAQHAAQKSDLKTKKRVFVEHQRSWKEMIMIDNPAFPTFDEWQKKSRPQRSGAQVARDRDVQDILGDSDAPPQRRDIRDFEHRVDGDAVEYFKRQQNGADGLQVGFVDRGRTISIVDWRDEETTLAALQLASQKFGTFAVMGGDEYKKLCVKLAAENGFKISNPELQDALVQEKIRASQERQTVARTKEFQDFEKYHAAVGADRYRITAGIKDKLFLIGDGGAPLKGVMADRVAMKIGEMIHLAKQGQKIELGPLSRNMHHFVVKGITDEKLKLLQDDGYCPCAIVRTGQGLHTAIINMKKRMEYDEAHGKLFGEKIGKLLSEQYGSGTAAGPSHAAPGFFQAELIKAAKVECSKIVELARKVIEDIEARRSRRTPAAPVKPDPLDVLSAPDSPSSRMMLRPTGPRPATPKI